MTRRLLLAAIAVVGACAVPVAQAAPPVIVPAPSFDFVDSTTCGFPVSVHYVANGETAKTFSDGKTIVSGPLSASFSGNGKTTGVLNISGPATIIGGTVIGHGVGAGPATLPDGTTTIAYMAGTVDLSGPTATLVHGHVLLDICAALS